MPRNPTSQSSSSTSTANQSLARIIVLGLLLLLVGGIAWFFFTNQTPSSWPLISITVLATLVILGLIFALKLSRQKQPFQPDYYSLFIIGVIWLPAGVASDNTALSLIGLVFLAIGIKNRDKWKRTAWKDLSPQQKRFKVIAVGMLGVMALAGLVAYLFYSR